MSSDSTRGWLRRIYPHNPLYIISAALVLFGIHHASLNADLLENNVKSSLLLAYVLMLALAAWLVVRLGRVWEDARTILLVLLLMFMAISTSFDLLCLEDPAAGARRLAVAMFACVIVVEMLLAALGIRLPLAYRAPFYVQLGLLFAFPAVLGRLSVDGHEERMYLGVLLFGVASGMSLLLLLPAIRVKILVDNNHGTPWRWPYYPWSVFVIMAVALSLRLWMLSVSFTDAKGLNAAFHPYFLVPILLGVAVLILELGLTHGSRAAQGVALAVLPSVVALSFPMNLSPAQKLSLDVLESTLAAPPMLTSVAVAVVACYSVWRRVSGSAPLLIASVLLISCLDPSTREFSQLHGPDLWFQVAATCWLVLYGIWMLDMRYTSAGAASALLLAYLHFDQAWLDQFSGQPAVMLWIAATLSLPLFCRDWLAEVLSIFGPPMMALVATTSATLWQVRWLEQPPVWSYGFIACLSLMALGYLVRIQIRWHLLPLVWIVTVLASVSLGDWINTIDNPQLRRGLAWYAAGCGVLLLAMIVSLWKGGFGQRFFAWIISTPKESQSSPNTSEISQ